MKTELTTLQEAEKEKLAVELKAARERQRAVEDLQRGVRPKKVNH